LNTHTHTLFQITELKTTQSQHAPLHLCLFTFRWHAPWSCVILCDVHAMHSCDFIVRHTFP